MCREKPIAIYAPFIYIGSPLRVQGKVHSLVRRSSKMRITPACAGKSLNSGRQLTIRQDHPCVCREKLTLPTLPRILLGSPLRVQGKGVVFIILSFPFRITPACAGKSVYTVLHLPQHQDHPCVCREKNSKPTQFLVYLGSPLRVQGKEWR